MIRGALILAIGYVVGYSHATARNEEVAKMVRDLRKFWDEAGEPSKEAEGESAEDTNTVTYKRMSTSEGETAP